MKLVADVPNDTDLIELANFLLKLTHVELKDGNTSITAKDTLYAGLDEPRAAVFHVIEKDK